MLKTCVLGAGAFGTSLAKHLADKGYPTALWARREDLATAIETDRCNSRYLPDAPLPDTLSATNDMEKALEGAKLVLFVVPSHATRDVAQTAKPLLQSEALVCCATKGIENTSLALMSEVLSEELGEPHREKLTFLTGPSFAKEVAAQRPTAVTIAGYHAETTEAVQHAVASDYFRAYRNDDVIGAEVGGALKNVVAIAAGAIDGLGFGLNARAALITRGLAEMSRLAVAKGGQAMTLAGLAGMGDLVLTCTGSLSRNRTVGFELGKGRTLAETLESLGQVAEGVRTTKSARNLGRKLGVDLPITEEVYRVLYEDKPAKQAVIDLMTRPLKRERD